MSNFQLSSHLFLQLALVLLFVKLLGVIGRRVFGQPQVVSEMVAGVLIGPSVYGHFFPDAFAFTFPPQSLPILYCAAQLGLVLYMFVIGNEFRTDLLTKKVRTAAAVSLSGILVPFVVAGGLAVFVINGDAYFTNNVSFLQRWLFIGAAISITAFPMLARIIHESEIFGSSVATVALAAGCMDDAASWCILALVVAAFSGRPETAALAIGGGIVFAVLVFKVIKPVFARLQSRRAKASGTTLSDGLFGAVIVMLMLSAYVTDRLGIYAVFGSFLLGVAMPKGDFAEEIRKKIEPVTAHLLLPLFFISSGLNTKLALLFDWSIFSVAAAVLGAALLGKFFACAAAAYAGGETLRSAASIGLLMNSRGLMELILLGIGLDRGIISPTLYTILALMAIITTVMATPLFRLVYRPSEAGMRPPTGGTSDGDAIPFVHTGRDLNVALEK